MTDRQTGIGLLFHIHTYIKILQLIFKLLITVLYYLYSEMHETYVNFH